MCVCSVLQLRQTRAIYFSMTKEGRSLNQKHREDRKGECRRKGGKLPQHSKSVPSDLDNTHDCKPREFLYKAFSK